MPFFVRTDRTSGLPARRSGGFAPAAIRASTQAAWSPHCRGQFSDPQIAAPNGRPPVPTVDVVIAALNEEASLPLVLAALPHPPVRRVVVDDNGSQDGTARVAREGGAVVVPAARRGYGSACLAGLAHLRANGPPDIVAFVDAGAVDGNDTERGRKPGSGGDCDSEKMQAMGRPDQHYPRDAVGKMRDTLERGAGDRSRIDVARMGRHDRLGVNPVHRGRAQRGMHYAGEGVGSGRIEGARYGGIARHHHSDPVGCHMI